MQNEWKKTALYTQVNGESMTHLKLQKSEKGDVTQQHIDIKAMR